MIEVLDPSRPAEVTLDEESRSALTLAMADIPLVEEGCFKIDLDTPLEQFFSLVTLLGVLALMIAAIILYEDGLRKGIYPLGGALLLLGGGILLKSHTDNYYMIDLNRRLFLYHFEFMGFYFDRLIAPFGRILGTTATGEKKSSKHSSWWEYYSVLVLKEGSVYPISDSVREGLYSANQRSEALAKVIGCPFVEGQSQCAASVERDPLSGELQIVVKPVSFMKTLLIIGAIVFFFILISVIVR